MSYECQSPNLRAKLRNWFKPQTEFVKVGKAEDGKVMMVAVPAGKSKQPSVKETQKTAILTTIKAAKEALDSIDQSFAEVYWMELSASGRDYVAVRLPGATEPVLLTDEPVGSNWFSLLARSMRKGFVQPQKKEYTIRTVCNPNNRFYDGNQIRIPKKPSPIQQAAPVPSRFSVERIFCSEYSVMVAKADVQRAGGNNIYGEQIEITREIWQNFMNSVSGPLRKDLIACNQSLLEFDTILEDKFRAIKKPIDAMDQEEQAFMENLTNTVLDVFSEHEELYRYYRLLFTLEESKKSQLLAFCASETSIELFRNGADLANLSNFSSWSKKERTKLKV